MTKDIVLNLFRLGEIFQLWDSSNSYNYGFTHLVNIDMEYSSNHKGSNDDHYRYKMFVWVWHSSP